MVLVEMSSCNDNSDEEIREHIVIFLDDTKQLQGITKKCKEAVGQPEEKGKVLTIGVNVDVNQVAKIDACLCSIIIHEPDKAQTLFQEVIFIALRSLGLLPDGYILGQVHVLLRVSNLPPLPDYRTLSKQLLECDFQSRYYTFHGFACSKSTPQEYSKSTRYLCRQADCKGSQANAFIRLYNRGAAESQVIRRDFQCVYCGSVLEEDVHARVLGEKVVVEMIDAGTQCPLQQTVNIIIRDDLIPWVQIGSQYTVVGIPVADFYRESHVRVTIEASSVTDAFIRTGEDNIPETIVRLHQDRLCSPWSFSSSLAYIFATEVSPPGTFHQLKMCLLLSLMQTGPTNKRRLDILAIGEEEPILQRMLEFGARMCSTTQPAGLHPLFPSVRESSSGVMIDGGAVLLTGGGICVLGDLSSARKEKQERITKVLQDKCIQVEVPKSGSASGKQFEQIPVNSTLWAYQKKIEKKQDILADSFGLVVSCSSSSQSVDEYVYAQLCQDILARSIHCQQPATKVISFVDFQKFIQVAASRNVSLSSEAETLIKGYFVTSRRMREGDLKRRHFPLTTLQTLSTLAVSHAKLCLHDEVTEVDAVMAIHLFEECLTQRFGSSFLNIHPLPHFKDDNLSFYIGPEHDVYMENFQSRLEVLCRPVDDTGFSPLDHED